MDINFSNKTVTVQKNNYSDRSKIQSKYLVDLGSSES